MKFLPVLLLFPTFAVAQDYNQLIVDAISAMPPDGTYAKYQKTSKGREFDDLYQTVADLNSAIAVNPLSRKLKVEPDKAKQLSFCSSATYLLFTEACRPTV